MADVEKRRKVIRGLECHATKGFVACQDCPYYPDELIYEDDDDMEGTICEEKLAADALALLREQEPRILSLGEAIEGKNGLEIDPYVFVEIKGREDIFIGSVSDISHYNYPDLSFRVGESFKINRNFPEKIYLNTDYMKTVRCWTHKPSKEQRRAVKWE